MCISFSKKGTDEVKQFIMQHYLNQMFDEYTAIPEPLSDFYDVLCIGLDWNDESPLLSPHNYSQPLPLDPGSCFPSSYEIFDWTFVYWFMAAVAERDDDEEEREDQMEMDQQPDQSPELGRRRVPQTPLARQVSKNPH